MVDLPTLASDVVQTVLFYGVPPVLWLFLFLLAWENPALARATGFGRLSFWLLLPGGLIGTIAQLPVVPIGAAYVAISVGGGLIPLFLSALLLRRVLRDLPGASGRFVVILLGATVASLLLVIALHDSGAGLLVSGTAVSSAVVAASLGVLAVAVLAPLAARVTSPTAPMGRRLGLLLGLASLGLFLTFLTTAAVPKVGIVSGFPWYLLTPVLVGLLSVVLVTRVAGLPAWQGITVAYPTATLGVIVGADVLRQPPLYGPGASGIYSIGGAGILDLVYLSGLLALLAAYAGFWVLRRYFGAESPPVPASVEAPMTSSGRLRSSLRLLVAGRPSDSVSESAAAAREARSVARGLAGFPAQSFSGHGWTELGAPEWADLDQANLDSLDRNSVAVGARDAWRAHLTARYLVRIGRDLGRRRLGSLANRSAAFLLDLMLLTIPAAGVWLLLSFTLSGTVGQVISGTPFNAAAYGYAAYAFVYFVVGEAVWGTTIGKRILHLRVRDRTMRPAGPLSIVVRDIPKLIPLTIVGIGGAAATILLARGGSLNLGANASGAVLSSSALALAAYVLVAVGVGVALCGLASAVAISSSGENQRLGDYIAGTWVIKE